MMMIYRGANFDVDVHKDDDAGTITASVDGFGRWSFPIRRLRMWEFSDSIGIGIAHMMPHDTSPLVSLDVSMAVESVMR